MCGLPRFDDCLRSSEQVPCLCACTCCIQQTFHWLIDKGAIHDRLDVHGRKHAGGEASIDHRSAREGMLGSRDLAKGEDMGISKCLPRLVLPMKEKWHEPTRILSLMVPTHHVHRFSVSVVTNAMAFPTVSSASSSSRRSSLAPGNPPAGECLLWTTPTDASTSF
jgi:hypothetical protein